MLLDYVREKVWQKNENLALTSFGIVDPDLCLSFTVSILEKWLTYQSMLFAKTNNLKQVYQKQLIV